MGEIVGLYMNDIYQMSLHETFNVSPTLAVTRVPGGWIYETYDDYTDTWYPTFVPFNNEFQGVKKNET